MDQPKIERLLRVMQLLINNRMYTIDDIAVKLDTSARTVYRYIDSFRSSGFLIEEENGFYSLSKNSKQLRQISDLIYFTEEEAFILKKAIESIDASNPVMEALKSKLYSVYNFRRLAEITVHKRQLNIVNALAEAFEEQKCVILKNYRSSNSSVVTDREVEPFAFGLNMIDIVCFEPLSGLNKIFKISRIGDVEILEKDWENVEKHRQVETDVFRIMSFERFPVKLHLTMLAANLLLEEFPMAEDKLTKISDDSYIFEDMVCSYEGVGRFALGLCNEVKVIDSPGFIKFLNAKRKNSKL